MLNCHSSFILFGSPFNFKSLIFKAKIYLARKFSCSVRIVITIIFSQIIFDRWIFGSWMVLKKIFFVDHGYYHVEQVSNVFELLFHQYGDLYLNPISFFQAIYLMWGFHKPFWGFWSHILSSWILGFFWFFHLAMALNTIMVECYKKDHSDWICYHMVEFNVIYWFVPYNWFTAYPWALLFE